MMEAMPMGVGPRDGRRGLLLGALLVLMALYLGGCAGGPQLVPSPHPIDRSLVEYPTGSTLTPYMTGLTAPTSFCFDADGNLLVAEGGYEGDEPHVFGVRPGAKPGDKNAIFEIYPVGRKFPFNLIKTGFRIYGPVGGIAAYKGQIYVSHRDENDNGVVTAFGYDGSHHTVVSGLPAQGDFGVTDLTVSTITDPPRLYFGLGAATNSAVVGLDNWENGWVRAHPKFCDVPYKPIKLLGDRFDSKNPLSGLFSGGDIAVTGPYQPFGVSNRQRIGEATDGKPSGAIYSISTEGGDLRVEAWGVRYPRGLVVNNYGTVFFTDDGMEMRGTRPVKDDPDGVFQLYRDVWYGWPDYSRSLERISEAKFQPPRYLIADTGYPDGVAELVNHGASGLSEPSPQWLTATLRPLSGAAKLDLVPATGPFRMFGGNLIIALWGDRYPFATSGVPLKEPTGYKLVRVDRDNGRVYDWVHNTKDGPGSSHSGSSLELERPIDVKFGPDGACYILDFGEMVMKHGVEHVTARTGKILRLQGPRPEETPPGK